MKLKLTNAEIEGIRKAKNIVDWDMVSRHYELPEDFIREFKDRVDWANISIYQTLSENFIREFQTKVNWENISRNQTLSEEFIIDFISYVHLRDVATFQIISQEFINMIFKNFFRPSFISYRTAIEPLHDSDISEAYLSIWPKDKEISWNEFLSKYNDKPNIQRIYKELNNKKRNSI